jgi:hypothetical protein
MARIPVFYSFHYANDVFRVQQVRNMGVIAGDEPVSPNDWEQLKRKGNGAVERWIDENMKYKRCIVVLIGAQTASRPWVIHEIRRAWDLGKGLVGIHIHNLKCLKSGTCAKGANPFDRVKLKNGQLLSTRVAIHDPWFPTAYSSIADGLEGWVNDAVVAAKGRF